jgi:hypothetical protein
MSSVPIRPARHRFGAGGGCYVVTVPRHSDHGQHPTDDSAEDVRTASARPLRGPTSEDWRSNQCPAMALVFEIADGHLTYGKLAQRYGVHISGMRSRVGGLTKRLHSKGAHHYMVSRLNGGPAVVSVPVHAVPELPPEPVASRGPSTPAPVSNPALNPQPAPVTPSAARGLGDVPKEQRRDFLR